MTMDVAAGQVHRPTLRRRLKDGLRLISALPRAGASRVLTGTGRAPRFAGAYATRADAETAIRVSGAKGYDDDEIADISFEVMCRRTPWDYPILLWLDRLLPSCPAVIDAGGHMGTKFIAFSDLLDLGGVDWTVYDLPAIVRAGRKGQLQGRVPGALRFEDEAARLPAADILLASGLLQYLDVPFPDFVDALPHRPRHILLNKVALRDGDALHTVERIGRGRVAYHIRDRAEWTAQMGRMGYDVVDTWDIPDLGHVIPTHPWLGRSQSRGFALRRRAP